jgi:hypothetical protein
VLDDWDFAVTILVALIWAIQFQRLPQQVLHNVETDVEKVLEPRIPTCPWILRMKALKAPTWMRT